jgi:hypothetical protein
VKGSEKVGRSEKVDRPEKVDRSEKVESASVLMRPGILRDPRRRVPKSFSSIEKGMLVEWYYRAAMV